MKHLGKTDMHGSVAPMRPVVWHSQELRRAVESGMSAGEIKQFLMERDCLTFPQLPSGLFPAINLVDISKDTTTYGNSWLRDSSWVAFGLWRDGQVGAAQTAAHGLIASLHKDRAFFEAVIKAHQAPRDDADRPPARFVGPDSQPLAEWANAQDDALGFSLWLIGQMAAAGDLNLDPRDLEAIEMVIEYLQAIQYWRDRDSGEWEELPRLNASSGGAVVAGLAAVRALVADPAAVDLLIAKGQQELSGVLPEESSTPGHERAYDAGLLFLVEPLGVAAGKVAETIIDNIEQHLVGDIGVRRYPGDSYWGPDYRQHFAMGERAKDFSDAAAMAERDRFLKPGTEAQWTLFDPLLSAYYARRFVTSKAAADMHKAGHYLQRSLGQIIDQPAVGKTVLRLPEAFFLEGDRWVPNDHLGLLWSQANLLYALDVCNEIYGSQPVFSS